MQIDYLSFARPVHAGEAFLYTRKLQVTLKRSNEALIVKQKHADKRTKSTTRGTRINCSFLLLNPNSVTSKKLSHSLLSVDQKVYFVCVCLQNLRPVQSCMVRLAHVNATKNHNANRFKIFILRC